RYGAGLGRACQWSRAGRCERRVSKRHSVFASAPKPRRLLVRKDPCDTEQSVLRERISVWKIAVHLLRGNLLGNAGVDTGQRSAAGSLIVIEPLAAGE